MTEYMAADADAVWGKAEEIRLCPVCDQPRMGTFGEYVEAQNGGRSEPSWDDQTNWVCDTCENSFDCGIDDDQ